jgi:predicted NACHT family NTPase
LRAYNIPGFETVADVELFLGDESPFEGIVRSILFLMDGLNEMPAQAETREYLQNFVNKYSQHRYILSCRSQDYSAIGGFRTAVLQRLSSEDIETFLVNYLRADRGRKVAREIFSDPQLEELGQTPLALFMLAQIARRSDEELPKNRGVLFEVFTDNLLQRTDNDWQKVLEPLPTNVPLALRKTALARLGIAMQEEEVWSFSRERWQDILTDEIREYVEAATPNQQAELANLTPDEVHDELKHSGLVRQSESRTWVEFAHHTYQEFFAALYQRDAGYDLEPHLRTNEARRRWQGTVVLLYGIVRDKSHLYAEIFRTR